MEYPSDEARIMMIADMRKIIEKYENKLKHTNYRPIQVKGNSCKTEEEIQGCLEADLINYDQYINSTSRNVNFFMHVTLMWTKRKKTCRIQLSICTK